MENDSRIYFARRAAEEQELATAAATREGAEAHRRCSDCILNAQARAIGSGRSTQTYVGRPRCRQWFCCTVCE